MGFRYVVQSGDSLWAIAQRFYGDGNRWPSIYNVNRSVVGDNPDLIFPGQVFYIP
jgi:nucleoid-associated protein YgaU